MLVSTHCHPDSSFQERRCLFQQDKDKPLYLYIRTHRFPHTDVKLLDCGPFYGVSIFFSCMCGFFFLFIQGFFPPMVQKHARLIYCWFLIDLRSEGLSACYSVLRV